MNNFIISRKSTFQIEISITDNFKNYYSCRAQLATFAASMLDSEIDAEPVNRSVVVFCEDEEQVDYVWKQAEKLNMHTI